MTAERGRIHQSYYVHDGPFTSPFAVAQVLILAAETGQSVIVRQKDHEPESVDPLELGRGAENPERMREIQDTLMNERVECIILKNAPFLSNHSLVSEAEGDNLLRRLRRSSTSSSPHGRRRPA